MLDVNPRLEKHSIFLQVSGHLKGSFHLWKKR